MGRVKERLKQKKIELRYTKEAVELLANAGFEPNFGARPVKRVIQQMVENEIALGVLKGEFKEEDAVLVDADSAVHGQLIMRKVESAVDRGGFLVANN